MTIQATCRCGASFKAKPQLAGRRVKCPSCGQPFNVPLPTAAGTIRARCPCGKAFAAKAALAGEQVSCPSCGGAFVVPDPRSTTSSPQLDPTSVNANLMDLLDGSLTAPGSAEEFGTPDTASSPSSGLPLHDPNTRYGRVGESIKPIVPASHQLVAYGLGFVLIGLFISVQSGFMFFGPLMPTLALQTLLGVAWAESVFFIIGNLLCLAVPRQARPAKAFLITSFAIQCASILILRFDLELFPLKAVPYVELALHLLYWIVFALFVRAIAVYLKRDDIAKRVVAAIVAASVLSIADGVLIYFIYFHLTTLQELINFLVGVRIAVRLLFIGCFIGVMGSTRFKLLGLQ